MNKDEILVDTIENSKVIVSPIKRNGRIIGGGVWLSQGDPINPTDFWISADEIDKFILSLSKAKDSLDCVYKECKDCYFYFSDNFECSLLGDDIEVEPNETCNMFKCKGLND